MVEVTGGEAMVAAVAAEVTAEMVAWALVETALGKAMVALVVWALVETAPEMATAEQTQVEWDLEETVAGKVTVAQVTWAPEAWETAPLELPLVTATDPGLIVAQATVQDQKITQVTVPAAFTADI